MRKKGSLFGLLLCLLLAHAEGAAWAQEPAEQLANAESRVTAATSEVSSLAGEVTPAEERLEAGADRAAPVRAKARAARGRAAAIERRQRAGRIAARTRMSRIEAERRDAAEKHDETVQVGIGIALAALAAAGLAFAWEAFRGSTSVCRLTRLPVGQAIGVCVGGGLLMVLVGAVLAAAGGAGLTLGTALFLLGFILANAFVLARHANLVRAGQARPILGRDRLPRRICQVVAGVFAALFLLGLGTAVFAGEDESSEASAALRQRAEGAQPSSPTLTGAQARAARLGREAAALIAAERSERRDLRKARRNLGRAEDRLDSAEGAVETARNRLEKQEEGERRKAEVEARRAAEETRTEEEETAQPPDSSDCNPNYSGCLDPNASDYDCAGGSGDGPEYTGTVEVIGTDEYDLDRDGDGIGCED